MSRLGGQQRDDPLAHQQVVLADHRPDHGCTLTPACGACTHASRCGHRGRSGRAAAVDRGGRRRRGDGDRCRAAPGDARRSGHGAAHRAEPGPRGARRSSSRRWSARSRSTAATAPGARCSRSAAPSPRWCSPRAGRTSRFCAPARRSRSRSPRRGSRTGCGSRCSRSSALVLLLLPDGRLPSPRWRGVVAALGVGAVALTVSVAFAPGPLDDVYADRPNPVAVPGLDVLGAGRRVGAARRARARARCRCRCATAGPTPSSASS